MPDKKYDLSPLREKIEDAIEALALLQAAYKDLTGKVWIPPIRLAPRKRREAADPSIRDRIGRIQNEIEAIDEQAGDAPDAFTDCLACAGRDFEEMLLQLEEAEERRLDPPTHLPRHIVPVIGLRPYLEVGE